jgi:hypothetical protein
VSHAVDQRSTSRWIDVDVAPDACPLHGDQHCDVLVVGSGRVDGTALNAVAVSPLADVKTHK